MYYPPIIPVPYQVFYILIPTISIIGNAFIVYVTIRSRRLRNPCNIFIGLISLGDLLHMFAQYVMIISHNIIDDHVIRQNICVLWQSIPLLALFFSSILLLNVAIDRLLSLRTFYKQLVDEYKIKYVTAQTLPATIFAVGMLIWAAVEATPNEMVVCVVTAPMRGLLYDVFVNLIIVINVLIILCYTVFLLQVRKIQMSGQVMKNIYRSLIIISATVIFGWFSTTLIASFANIFRIKVEQLYVHLLAGLFVNFACATNFFVYYAVSNEYRQVFDEYLFIRRVKKAVGVTVVSSIATKTMDRASEFQSIRSKPTPVD
ncbi:7 transmembrane receptor [Necator americanus]|uniref:7 transmembrane receptor n=1 Tax=Necator americanus TaxID=51031 RepID=W2T395_NECAM|nr:7 transmembrane receptor [Necator americanus]ETN75447.1 7 transmembrane receptor [Necator americanus]